jgi:hypothetical protein
MLELKKQIEQIIQTKKLKEEQREREKKQGEADKKMLQLACVVSITTLEFRPRENVC